MNRSSDGMASVKETANHLDIDVDEIISLIKEGVLNGRLIEGEWYVSLEEIGAWYLSAERIVENISNDNEEVSSESSGTGFWVGLGLFAILGKVTFLLTKCASVVKVTTVVTALSYSDEVVDVGRLAARGFGASDEAVIGARGFGASDEAVIGARYTDDFDSISAISKTDDAEYSMNNANKMHLEQKKIHINPSHSLNDVSELSIENLTKEELAYFTQPKKYDVAHFVSIPSDEASFKNIFLFNPRKKEIEKIHSTRNELSLHENVYIAQSDDGSKQVRKFLDDAESEYITFTGHNENGLLMLPNGKSVEIHKVAEMCLEFAKRCVFLSCKSKKHIKSQSDTNIGVSNDLTYSDAHSIINKINKKSQQSLEGEISYNEFSTFVSENIDTVLATVQFKTKVVLHVKRGGRVSGVGGVSYKVNEYLSNDDEQQNNLPRKSSGGKKTPR